MAGKKDKRRFARLFLLLRVTKLWVLMVPLWPFFRRFWAMLKDDILVFTKEFHYRGKLSRGIRTSFISLIPKKKGDIGIKDFRSISLIGSVYTILTKVLARRLQKILPCIILKEQRVFVKGRHILNGVLLANECVHSRDRERKPGVICKLDLEKAYDRVDWGLLQYLLCRMGFGVKWINWIKEYVSLACFFIMINCSPKSFFLTQRGLRQGDPIYPSIFVIIAEALSRMGVVAKNRVLIRGGSRWLNRLI